MISTTWSRKSIALCAAVAVLSVYSMVALGTPGQRSMSGELSVSGQVTVNGQTAISGATVFSDSVITTADNSTAVVSLGKLGRVELQPNTSLRLTFSEANVSANLDAGKVRVSTTGGIAAVVSTKDGSAVADAQVAASFTVDVACGNTVVNSQAGRVELRGADKTTPIAAGSSGTAGTPQAGTKCARLTRPDTLGGLHGGALAALLLAAGGAVAAAIIAATHNNNLNFGGNVAVVSPTR